MSFSSNSPAAPRYSATCWYCATAARWSSRGMSSCSMVPLSRAASCSSARSNMGDLLEALAEGGIRGGLVIKEPLAHEWSELAALAGGPSEDIVGIDAVEAQQLRRHHGIGSQDILGSEQVQRLGVGAAALPSQDHVDGGAAQPPTQQSAAVEASRSVLQGGCGTEAENPDLGDVGAEHTHGLGDADHGGVVGPHPSVDETHPITAELVGGEERGRRCRSHGHLPHRHAPVTSQPRVVRSLEQIDVVAAEVVRGDDQAV